MYVMIVGTILSLTSTSITAKKITFGNKTSIPLYVWPIPENELPKMLGKLPPNSLDIQFDIPNTIRSVLIMDDKMMQIFKSYTSPSQARQICGTLPRQGYSPQSYIEKKYKECNDKIIAKTDSSHRSAHRTAAFAKLDPNKQWIAFTPVSSRSKSLVYGKVAFAEKI